MIKKIIWYKTTQKSASLLQRSLVQKNMLTKQIGKICRLNYHFTKWKYVDNIHYFSEEEIIEFYKLLRQRLNSNFIKCLLRQNITIGNNFLALSKYLNKLNFNKLSNKKIEELFIKWCELYSYIWAFTWVSYFSINVLTQSIKESLKLKTDKIEKIFADLTINTRKNHLSKRQDDFIRLAKIIERKSDLKKIIIAKEPKEFIKFCPTEVKIKIEALKDKYSWLGIMFLIDSVPTTDDIVAELKEIVIKGSKKSEDNIIRLRKLQKKLADQAVKKLAIKGELFKDIFYLKSLAHQRTEELFFAQMGEYLARSFLKTTASRLSVNYNEFIYLTYDEILKMLSGGGKRNKINLLKKEIKKRQKNFALMLIDNQRKLLSGADIKKWREKEELEQNINIIKGTPASPGRAKGRVVVIKNLSDLNLLKRGDILVTYMTTPNFISAMRKSAAIITNDGGLTCHAAIISRELGIPCIVGTKIATKVLKNGDLVDVDATHGKVMIIKKK